MELDGGSMLSRAHHSLFNGFQSVRPWAGASGRAVKSAEGRPPFVVEGTSMSLVIGLRRPPFASFPSVPRRLNIGKSDANNLAPEMVPWNQF